MPVLAPLRPFRSGPEHEFRGQRQFANLAPTVTGIVPNAGNVQGGTSVTITGTNFILDGTGANILVFFKDVAATSVVVVDRQTITAVVPEGAETGLVDVTVWVDGINAVLAGAFTYYEGFINQLSPTHGPFSGGTVITIEGYNFVAGSTVLFDETPGTDFTFIDSGHIKITSPNHVPGYTDVIIEEPGGALTTKRGGFQFTLFNRGEDLRRSGIVVHDTLGHTPNTADFTIDGDAPAPQIGEKIEIRDEQDNNRLLFSGTVQSTRLIYEGQTDQLAWKIHAVDFTWLFNRRRPFGSYINTSVSDVIKDLVAKFAPDYTTVHVQTNLARVTAILDGSKDFTTVMNELMAAIGGGHWDIDYSQDVHAFHVVPPSLAGLQLPPSAMPASTGHITVAEGALSGAGQLFEAGYYLFRHTLLYSDGTESVLQSISNVLRCTGKNILSFTGVPTGADIGTITCVGRRVYYNRFVPGYPGGDKFEDIKGFVQINDNTTTAFTTWFGGLGSSNAAVVDFGAADALKTYPTPSVATPDGFVLLSNAAANYNLTGAVPNGTYGLAPLVDPPGAGSIPRSGTNMQTGWNAGEHVLFAFTAFADGETTLGPSVGFDLIGPPSAPSTFPLGPVLQCPATMPEGAQNMACYASRDAGATWHIIAAGIFPNQVFFFTMTKALFDTEASPPTTNNARITGPSWVGYDDVTEIPAAGPFPQSGTPVAYFATVGVAQALEAGADNARTKPPVKVFTGHPIGPLTASQATIDTFQGTNFWEGTSLQFKVAYLYRDGTVSFPGPASPTVTQPSVNGTGIKGYNLTNLPIGPTLGTLDVVARVVYWCSGVSSNPNLSISWPGPYGSTSTPPVGFTWPVPFKEPDWVHQVGGIIIVPENTSTSLLQFQLAGLGWTSGAYYTGVTVGNGNLPYGNVNLEAVSVDPLPLWPNADGPSLEDDDPPEDLTNDPTITQYLLHEDSQSQPFTVSTDLSQVRNRVLVIGSGSIVAISANVGDVQVQVADISAFSPAGGQVKYDDPGTGDIVKIKYSGITGVVGTTFIKLETALQRAIPQGTNIANFFQADDLDSQKFLSQIELDKGGAKTDGVHEYVIIDTSLKAVFQLYMRAFAELELYSKPIVKIMYATRDPKSRSGQTVHVDMTDPPCQGDFLIQDVTIDQIHDESDDLSPRYTVTATSVQFELDDLLLQIIGKSITGGGGGSSAGIAPTAIQTTQSSIPGPAAGSISLLQVNGTLTNAQVIALNTTPVVAVAAIAGSIIVPVSATFRSIISVNTTSGVPPNVQYHGINANVLVGSLNWGTNTPSEQILFPANVSGVVTRKGLSLDITAAFSNSGGSALNQYYYSITYYIVTPSI